MAALCAAWLACSLSIAAAERVKSAAWRWRTKALSADAKAEARSIDASCCSAALGVFL
jgi:hypothetical protein